MSEIFCFLAPFKLKQTVYLDRDGENARIISDNVHIQDLSKFMLNSAIDLDIKKIRLVGDSTFAEGYKEKIISEQKSNPEFSNHDIIVEVNK